MKSSQYSSLQINDICQWMILVENKSRKIKGNLVSGYDHKNEHVHAIGPSKNAILSP